MSVEFSVVVPVCNEAENVEPLAREIDAALAGRAYEMIFVDDGSTDDTAATLQRLKSELPALRVLRHSFRSGQSAAVASGVRAARAPWIATLDGDGQNDPADIPKLIAARDPAARTAACSCSWATARPAARTPPSASCSRASPMACAAVC